MVFDTCGMYICLPEHFIQVRNDKLGILGSHYVAVKLRCRQASCNPEETIILENSMYERLQPLIRISLHELNLWVNTL